MNKTQNNLNHQISKIDQYMIRAIEGHTLQLAEFTHATHVKLAYCYLSQLDLRASQIKMSKILKGFLRHNSVDKNKFHVTLTHGWLIAVWHFMQQSPPMKSSDEFIEYNPVLLNKDILLSH